MGVIHLILHLQEGLAPINLVIDDKIHRATPGGTGDVKTISNYAPVHFIASHLILASRQL